MRALIVFDKFKDSLSARQACAVTAGAIRAVRPKWELDVCPLADGGDGFADVLTCAAGGEMRTATVVGPRREPVCARFGLVARAAVPLRALDQLGCQGAGPVAVVEMALASGLALVPPEARDVWQSTSYGTGELLRAAAQAGADCIILGVGGSATNDLGIGALVALGMDVGHGRTPVGTAPAAWDVIAGISGAIAPLPPVVIACDVSNPLLGSRGAAAVYGPQKGLRPEDVAQLDRAAARVARMLCATFDRPESLAAAPGAGAAGGIAFGLMAAIDARLLAGADFVAAWLDLDRRIAAADLVISGEGCFDESSMSGKGPGAVVSRALAAGKPVQVFAGSVHASPCVGVAMHAITPAGTPLGEALRCGADNLGRTVRRVFGS